MKDNFSTNSELYKQFRPSYPSSLFPFIYSKLHSFEKAWDCGCGNGQITTVLQQRFGRVYATDISAAQLETAPQFPNVQYSLQPAEKTTFPKDRFDLVTVGQAIHWFNFKEFYTEVQRTAKNGALIVVVGYGKLQIDTQIDELINKLYSEILENYWDRERKYIDQNYTTIPFPFDEIPCPHFENSYNWTLEHLLGYLRTWSAVKHYQKQHRRDPVSIIQDGLQHHWRETERKKVDFPLLLRMGRIHK